MLSAFKESDTLQGTLGLFGELGIKLNTPTNEPLGIEVVLPEVPASVRAIFPKVARAWFVGTIDDATLRGEDEALDLGTEIERIDEHYKGMMVFAVDTAPGEHLTRSEISALTRALNRLSKSAPVALIVRRGDYISFAICERTPWLRADKTGEKPGKVSLLRDIYIPKPHRGHHDILCSLNASDITTFDALYKRWMEAFDTDTLTKRFYRELSNWYALAIQVIRFPNDLSTDADDAKYNHEGAILLITRLIFVWFLKQRHLIPEELFDEEYIGSKLLKEFNPREPEGLFQETRRDSNYYRGILQNLFFATLNCPLTKEGSDQLTERRFKTNRGQYDVNTLMRYANLFRAPDLFVSLSNRVPFLNGGLFDCLDDKENDMYYDGFSERQESIRQLCVPDYLFFSDNIQADLSAFYDDKKLKSVAVRGLIKIFNSYQFTIEENTPLEQDVALDPELLGKVFENLLAAFNPETKTTARKQTGSFYTPREIVQYMVNESLVAHLNRKVGEDLEEQYRRLLDHSDEQIDLSLEQRKSIMEALYDCKILDPACGSGAFPMGILQQMVHVISRLDPDNTQWKALVKTRAGEEANDAYLYASTDEREEMLEEIHRTFDNRLNNPDYARKLYLIENCIYGVDIQPIATQISQLRFFISLIVDQATDLNNPADNFGIRPLPNLEAKFVAANSLIGLNRDSNLGDNDTVVDLKARLKRLNHRVFTARSRRTKRKVKAELAETRKALADELARIGFCSPSESDALAHWDMFDQNHHASFFDPEWMFGIRDGFDIVIGNPPYVRLSNDEGRVGHPYENKGFETFLRTADLYCLFYERGYHFLAPKGLLCFITSNKWMRAGYGEKTRKFFTTKTNPKLLIDFAGTKVFESATVDTNILLFTKEDNQGKTMCCVVSGDGFSNLNEFIPKNEVLYQFLGSESWVILSPIEESIKKKIESVGTPLKDWHVRINYGIKTGCNEAFVISTEKREEILANCADEDERRRTEELIRPILRGRDIKRYGYNWAGLWLIATFPSRHYDIDTFPAVRDYLLSFGKHKLEQSGKTYEINGIKGKVAKRLPINGLRPKIT